jgi:hypothetical protein
MIFHIYVGALEFQTKNYRWTKTARIGCSNKIIIIVLGLIILENINLENIFNFYK